VNNLDRSLHGICASLRQRNVRFALVGGLAVAVRGEPRLTRDADFAVVVASDAEAEALIMDLRADDYEPFAAIEHKGADRLATIRLAKPGQRESTVVDLLFASSGIEREIVASATEIEIVAGLTMPVATVAHLIVMKVLARDDRNRPADADDLIGLASVATESDWALAVQDALLVVERGYNRGRNLEALINELRHKHR
jgi:predicted nucleotidyltransferase